MEDITPKDIVTFLIQLATSPQNQHHQEFIDVINLQRRQITVEWYMVLLVTLNKLYKENAVPEHLMINLVMYAPPFPTILRSHSLPDIDLCVHLPSKH